MFGDLLDFDGQHGLSAYNKTDQEKFEDSDSTFISPKFVQTVESKPISEWIIAVGKHEGFISSEHWIETQELLDAIAEKYNCALPGFVDSKNEEKTERNAGYLVVSHSGGGMLRQGTRKGIRRTPANRGMRAHWVVKGLDISEDVCHGMCP